ncbi:alpha/beta fold hydrolase [Mycobacterium marseillense]|uniref:alpha/beta fold hydrolase n=1 Tax=Mycobacterium marseillense TaxID=701042 RepID=UPI0011A300A5|nr:alpha/beta fold hydrolase [Mycobacterium marseillense]
MTIDRRVFDLYGPGPGYQRFHQDVSVNFQCNRWLEWIGPEAHDEIAVTAHLADTYEKWIAAFLALADRVRAQGRDRAGAYYDRAAEFFMTPEDTRKSPARSRFVATMRQLYAVRPDRVPYEDAWLPAYDLPPSQAPSGPTLVIFGGFDSYIEDFFPLLMAIAATGHRVVAFDGPGQGTAFEDAGIVFTHEWERPVAAVLDHYGLDDVTAVGVSMGGGLVIRAAAFEPRIRRVVAWDIFDDELEVLGRQIAPGATPLIRVLLAMRARPVINLAAHVAARRPVARWGLQQGMHITATTSPYDFLTAARAITTRRISNRVTADVLLIAGTDDHYVPLHQLHRQARNLTAARSVTTRTFTAAEHAGNHCQIGNVSACVRTILSWSKTLTSSSQASRPGTKARQPGCAGTRRDRAP